MLMLHTNTMRYPEAVHAVVSDGVTGFTMDS